MFVDESGFSLLPGSVRTYAPKGQTPILRPFQTHDHLSVMSGITLEGKLYTMVRARALTSADSVTFLRHLVRHVSSKVLVVWDGSPIHKGEVRTSLTNGGASYVHLEQLPPYAPDLNPDEGVWQHLKHGELRNVCCSDLSHLRSALRYAIVRLQRKPHVIQACFPGAGLCTKG